MLLAIDVTLERLDPGSGNIADDTGELGTTLGHVNSEHWSYLSSCWIFELAVQSWLIEHGSKIFFFGGFIGASFSQISSHVILLVRNLYSDSF